MATRTFSAHVKNLSWSPVILCGFALVLTVLRLFNGPPQPEFSYAHMVFGIDDREVFSINTKPWSSLGRVEVQLGDKTWGNCTGSLIDRDLVLTSAHCLVSKGRERGSNIWFRAGEQGHGPVAESRVIEKWVGTTWPDKNRADDWAILQLEDPLGDSTGWFSLSPELIGEHRQVSLVGYGDDFLGGRRVGIHSKCSLRLKDPRFGYFTHDCDMNAGTSGAPMVIFQDETPQVVALNVAHRSKFPIFHAPAFSLRSANIAIGLTKCADLVKSIRPR